MTYVFIILIIIVIALAFGITLSINTLSDLHSKIESLEKDIERLEDLCTSFITENDLDDFCESLYTSIQSVGDKVKTGIQNEINSK